MLPTRHIFFGFIFSVLLLIFIPEIEIFGAGIIFLSSFLIDADHYFYYIAKKNDFNLNRCYNWFREKIKKALALPLEKRKEYYYGLYIFHGFEVILFLLFFGTLMSKFLLFVLTGFNFHLFLDAVADNTNKINSGKYSIIINLINSKKLKKLMD